MKLSKAVEILSDHDRLPLVFKNPDLHDSIKLGIEALKRHDEIHHLTFQEACALLPGEDSFIDTSRSEHAIKRILESPLGRQPKG